MKPVVAKSGFLGGTNPTVAIVSKVVIVVFVLFGLLQADAIHQALGLGAEIPSKTFSAVKGFILGTLKWYYIAIVAFFLFFVIWLAISRYGSVRLGKDTDRPEFSNFAWFAMLFGCGMGIGLVFWSIAEPIYHFQSNPFIEKGEEQTALAALTAMRLTFFHWGLHPWAIYVIVALSLAYFSYRKGLPLTIRSSLYPIIGNRIYGPIGHAVDILAVFATVFGVATSLGLGVQQMNTGLNQMFGMPVGTGWQILLILIISAVAVVSVVSGVNKGIRILSNLNLWLSFSILAFLLLFGPTRFLLRTLLQSTGDYLANVVPLSFWTDANQNRPWQGWWTAFYWGWWIAWSPFVGMFIARISKGRTIRQFVIGVLLLPTAFGFIWLSLFGGTALYIELFGQGGVVAAVKQDVTLALYTTLDQMPGLDAAVPALFGLASPVWLSALFAFIATLLIATYFITSSDSGTLVVATLLSMGDPNPRTLHRVIWGFGEGAVAAILLLAGGLGALQTASITAALPFSVIMLFMCYGIVKALQQEDLGPQYAPVRGASARRAKRAR
ncbi:MAG: BCCT family transporter [Acidiferrobacterales bacterium]